MDETDRAPRHASRSHAGDRSRSGLRRLEPAHDGGAGKGLFRPALPGHAPGGRGADHGWRNQRLIDILTVLALLGLLIAGYRYFEPADQPTETSFIVPSQHVHW